MLTELAVMFIEIVFDVAHCPLLGVNVYVVVPIDELEIVGGFHVPIMLLFDVVGRDGITAHLQNGPIFGKVGTIGVLTAYEIVTNPAPELAPAEQVPPAGTKLEPPPPPPPPSGSSRKQSLPPPPPP